MRNMQIWKEKMVESKRKVLIRDYLKKSTNIPFFEKSKSADKQLIRAENNKPQNKKRISQRKIKSLIPEKKKVVNKQNKKWEPNSKITFDEIYGIRKDSLQTKRSEKRKQPIEGFKINYMDRDLKNMEAKMKLQNKASTGSVSQFRQKTQSRFLDPSYVSSLGLFLSRKDSYKESNRPTKTRSAMKKHKTIEESLYSLAEIDEDAENH